MKPKKKFKKVHPREEEETKHRLHKPQKNKEKYKGPKYWLEEEEDDMDIFADYRNEEE